jgi:hypothetical protein
LAFAKVSEMTTKKLQAKARLIWSKDTIFDPATLLTLDQDTIKAISNFCQCHNTGGGHLLLWYLWFFDGSHHSQLKVRLHGSQAVHIQPLLFQHRFRFVWVTTVQWSKWHWYTYILKFYLANDTISGHRSLSVRNPKNFAWQGAIAYSQKETDTSKWMTNFFDHSLHSTLLDKLSGFMKAESLYATAFPLICTQSVTYSGANTDNTLQARAHDLCISLRVWQLADAFSIQIPA